MLCWAIGCIRQEGMVLAWTPLYLPPALFLVLGAAQLVSGQTINSCFATRDSIIMGCVYLILFALAATLFGNVALAQWLRLGKVVNGLYVSALHLRHRAILCQPRQDLLDGSSRWGGNIFGPT